MNLEDYITAHSEPEPQNLAQINRETHLKMINPRMISGHFQGRVLSMISHMIQPLYILEIGTFTGYSALCLAEGLQEKGLLHTIECDDELEDFIVKNLSTSEWGNKIKLHIGNALEVIEQLNITFDLVFIDADKMEYESYYKAVFPKVKKGGYILVDNTLWNNKVLKPIDNKDKETLAIMDFNRMIASDTRIEKVLLPVRDGLTLMRKKI